MTENLCSSEDFDPLGRSETSFNPKAAKSTDLNQTVSKIKSRNISPFIKSTTNYGLPESQATIGFRQRFFPWATPFQWQDWRWQLQNRITTTASLERIIRLSKAEQKAIISDRPRLPVAITPYYMSLLDINNPAQALRRTVVPTVEEHLQSPGESDDPLGEDHDSPVPGLVHRYPDRVLFMATEYCSTYCRYCTRSRMVGRKDDTEPIMTRWAKALNYIRSTPEIRDVLLSGGDPLTLSDQMIEYLLSKLRHISHVEIIRIGTKVPMVLPQRITLSLTRMLGRYHPLWISVHATHPEELTPEAMAAHARLADAGIPLGSQTVLLAGINDEISTMRNLMHGLMRSRVRPYYLYQCDPITGSGHFRTPVKKGLEIIRGLQGHTTGYAVPTYVIDAPGGGGKIPLTPDYVIGADGDSLVLKNYTGDTYRYPF